MFSEKYGYKIKEEIQYENITEELRTRIWNLFYTSEIEIGSQNKINNALTGKRTIEMEVADKLGFLLSDLRNPPDKVILRHILTSEWFEVYDFIEIHLSCLNGDVKAKRAEQYNNILEYEKSGYRVIDCEVVPITNEGEIKEIEQALSTPYESVNQHLKKALSLYADLESPDYENSIKESICAVEAICCIITGSEGKGSTLGQTLGKLKCHGIHIHSAMEKAFSSLYGYTSDENGIRHGGIDFKDAPSEDAKYMLVSCSSFINYLKEKWNKAKNNSHE